MTDSALADIIRICLSIEKKAESAYLKLAEVAEDDTLRSFWKGMSCQETTHAEYWQKLLHLAETDAIPPLFDSPLQVKNDMEEVLRKIDALEANFMKETTTKNAFLLAYRMEFYLLNPSFTGLFHFMKSVAGDSTLIELYDDHLNSFIETLNRYGGTAPELELLGETIERLWRDNLRLSRLNHMDGLTGVLNRRGLETTLVPLGYLARRHGFHLGAVMIDIDDFKRINDSLGHPVGDEILKEVAEAIRAQVRKSDIVGRYGGEEFIVIMSPVDAGSMGEIADNLRTRIASETSPRGMITVSAGAACGQVGQDVSAAVGEIIKQADANLLRAKAAGKNRVVSGYAADSPLFP